MREIFFYGEDNGEEKAKRAARLLHRLSKKTVYITEDWGEPWGFFVSAEAPMLSGCIYAVIGR